MKTPNLRTRLSELRRQRRCLQLEQEVAQLAAHREHQQAAHQVELAEAWHHYNFVDPHLWRTDSFGRPLASPSPIPRTPSTTETEPDLAQVRSMARWLSSANCAGVSIQQNLTNYVIGRGFTFTASSRLPRGQTSPALLSAVQDVLAEFLDDHDWSGDFDRELFWRWRRDGEFFLALYPTPAGRTRARLIEPEQIAAPPVGQTPRSEFIDHLPHATNFSSGIHTADHDVQLIHGYCLRWEIDGQFDYLPAEWMEHAKANVDRNVKRGLSDFYPAYQWLLRQERLLRNTAEGATIQAAIAFVRQHAAGTTRAAVEQFRTAEADTLLTQRTGLGNLRTQPVQNYESGTILDIPRGLEYHPGPLGAERGPLFVDISQAILRHVGTRWSMPEYMISGDASNANYASSLVAESPFVKAVESLQSSFKTLCQRILWKVLRNAANGRLNRFGPFSRLIPQIDLLIDAPAISTRDPNQETLRRQILHSAGILSPSTWATQEGLDHTLETEQGAKPKN